MKLRYNYRLYPDPSQRAMLATTFGCARVVWNDALAARKAARRSGGRHIGDAEIQRLVLTAAKKTIERAWLERKLAKLQRALSRTERGSNNRERSRVRVARQRAKVADARRDFLHQVSTSIIRDDQAVYIEGLSVQGLARGRLSKSVHDAGWGMFTALLEGKALRYVGHASRSASGTPSSQLCPCCKWTVGKLPLEHASGTAADVTSITIGTSQPPSTSWQKDNKSSAHPWPQGLLDTA